MRERGPKQAPITDPLIIRVSDERYAVQSRTDVSGETFYSVGLDPETHRAISCGCEAGQHQHPCWHLAAVNGREASYQAGLRAARRRPGGIALLQEAY